jgi:hypothetical protein
VRIANPHQQKGLEKCNTRCKEHRLLNIYLVVSANPIAAFIPSAALEIIPQA